MRLSFLRKVFLVSAIILGGFYILTIVFLKSNEESMIFFPDKSISRSPADSGWQFEEIVYSVKANMDIRGWKINGRLDSDSLPSILYFHGNAGNIGTNISSLGVLRNVAYRIFAFDYRGYGYSDGHTTAETFIPDCEAMYRYIIDVEKIAPSRLILYGQSLGSYGAAYLAEKHPEVGGLVMEGAFTSIPDRAAELYKILPIHAIMSVEMNNLELMPKIHVPVLFISSKKDQIIPLHHNQALFDAANQPKFFLQLENGSHDSALRDNHNLVISTFWDYFMSHKEISGTSQLVAH